MGAGPGPGQAAAGRRSLGAAAGALCRPAAVIEIFVASEALAVRLGLDRAGRALAAAGVSGDLALRVEIALAEALNNVAEHAYGGASGTIRLGLGRCPVRGDILCTIEDRGRPMPGGVLPEGRPPALDAGPEALPEGGFGWFLIRSLGRDIRYRRAGGVNRLRFRIVREAGEDGMDAPGPAPPASRPCRAAPARPRPAGPGAAPAGASCDAAGRGG